VNGDLGEGEEEGHEKDGGLLHLDSLELLIVEQTMNAPGLAEEEPKENIEGNDLKPGTEKARGRGRNSGKRQATHGNEADKGHGCSRGGRKKGRDEKDYEN